MVLSPPQRFIVFVIAAFLIDYLPLVNLPFLWSETFFHEISHGLAALLTGGEIVRITLNFNGSGTCETVGGAGFLVAFSGYAGSALWGLMIYRTASVVSQSSAKIIVAVIIALLSVTLLFWARSFSSIVILLILISMFSLPLYTKLWISVKSFIQLVGMFVLLDAIRSPLYLLDGRDLGDGTNLASMTWIPEIIWIALWVVIAAGSLYTLWRHSVELKLDRVP